uniref:Uncharacterized protein n=1 Tax=Alexandrium catenella TaxID=2925 RepID=A0A7S1L6T4_ALECA|mmetsp:Transcript_107572/g.286261  ORF Transcript_107572/g.286261 Transcript_107572/m.286261 type:complete len:333 (+) Transcript_107572:45-1043(+)
MATASVDVARDWHGSMRFFRRDAPRADVEVLGRLYSGVVQVGAQVDGQRTKPSDYFERHKTTIVDARTHLRAGKAAWSFERNGFCYIKRPEYEFEDHASQDRKRVDAEFGPRVCEAVRRAVGARRAFWLSHQRRAEDGGFAERPAVDFSHADYGPEYEEQLRRVLASRYGLPEREAGSCGLCLVNLWAPVGNPAYRNPLALLDGSTVDMEQDTVPWILHPSVDNGYGYFQEAMGEGQHARPQMERVPQAAKDAPALAPLHSARHRWVFLSDMTPEEAVIFKQYDFRSAAACKATFHSAFADQFHKDWKACPGRRSIECRVILTFDPEPTPKL